jgi:NADH:ubiquinone oxidoreductase subunit K
MEWWKMLNNWWKTICRWWSILPLILALIAMIIYLLFMDGCHSSILKVQNDITLQDKSDLLSWMYGGIMSLVSFLALFIAFTYENKLIVASKNKSQIYYPYSLNFNEIRLSLINFSKSISKDQILNHIYWIFILVSFFSIIIWGLVVGWYTNYQFIDIKRVNSLGVLHITIFSMWLILTFVLISISIILNLVRNKKDPLDKGYLPNEHSLVDIDYLKSEKADVEEFLFKCAPIIEIIKNPPLSEPKYELNILFPIKLKNVRFVIKIFDNEKKLKLRIFGVLNKVKTVGETYFNILTDNLNLDTKDIGEYSTAEFRFYDKDYNLVGLFVTNACLIGKNIKFIADRKVDVNIVTTDNDYFDIKGRKDEIIDFTYV